MTVEARATAELLLAGLKAEGEAPGLPKDRIALIGKMLLGYPQGNANEHTGQARGELYLDALDDIPPEALRQALRQWSRSEAGDEHDYRWAPAPGVLRRLCLQIVDRMQRDVRHLEDMLNAVPLERAMDPTPLTLANPLIPALRPMA